MLEYTRIGNYFCRSLAVQVASVFGIRVAHIQNSIEFPLREASYTEEQLSNTSMELILNDFSPFLSILKTFASGAPRCFTRRAPVLDNLSPANES